VTVQAAIARRLAFLDTLAWEVRTPEGADPALAQEQAELLRYAYNGIDNLRDASRALAMAAFRGFAILDKVPADADGRIERLDPIEQWLSRHLPRLASGRMRRPRRRQSPPPPPHQRRGDELPKPLRHAPTLQLRPPPPSFGPRPSDLGPRSFPAPSALVRLSSLRASLCISAD